MRNNCTGSFQTLTHRHAQQTYSNNHSDNSNQTNTKKQQTSQDIQCEFQNERQHLLTTVTIPSSTPFIIIAAAIAATTTTNPTTTPNCIAIESKMMDNPPKIQRFVLGRLKSEIALGRQTNDLLG